MQAFSLRDMEVQAQRRIDPAVYDYFAGGAGDAAAGDQRREHERHSDRYPEPSEQLGDHVYP